MNNLRMFMDEHPVVKELRDRIQDCRNELLKLLDDWYYLLNILHPRLMFAYDSLFGDMEYEYFKKQLIAEELERRVELLSLRLRRGEKINDNTIKYINNVVKSEFKANTGQDLKDIDDFEEYAERWKKNDSGLNKNNEQQAASGVAKEIPTLYRNIVKKLHPDVSGESEEFKKYWNNVQDAYKKKNLERLRLFHQTLCKDNKDYPNPQNEEISLRAEIKELEMHISSEKRKINNLRRQEPFIIEEKLNDKMWVANRKKNIKDRIFQVDRRIQQNRRILYTLTGRDFLSQESHLHEANSTQS